jgi:hypothetical protein
MRYHRLRFMDSPSCPLLACLNLSLSCSLPAAEMPAPVPIQESFGSDFDAKRFSTPIPNKNTQVRDGVLWTHGSSGGKYPPLVYLPVEPRNGNGKG